jgi:septum formation protein
MILFQQDPELPKADIVIGADTVVVKDGQVLEKPRDKEHAYEMLKQLSGSSHHVLTGVHIMYKTNEGAKLKSFVERTEVVFSTIDTDTMQACKYNLINLPCCVFI